MRNFFPKGVRTASEFLMSLHLNGAFKENIVSNLQIRLPAVVIGGGLTAIDVATEIQTYYPVQLRIFFDRYNFLLDKLGYDYLHSQFTEEDILILKEFNDHYNIIKDLSDVQKREFIRSLGGVKILYRKSIKESPAYKLNSHELQSALYEGIIFIENSIVEKFNVDENNHLSSIKIKKLNDKKEQVIKCNNVIISIGNNFNHKIINDNKCLFEKFNNRITSVGDFNLNYTGSVVKAINSSTELRHKINDDIKQLKLKNISSSISLVSEIENKFQSKIIKIDNIAENIFEVFIYSPAIAKKIQPGQFFKLQNYSKYSEDIHGIKMLMEPLALTACFIDRENGIISSIILNVGSSSNICRTLRNNEKVIVMGPIGQKTKILPREKVMIVGGGVGNAVLFGIADAMKKEKCNITYFAGYRSSSKLFKQDYLESIIDKIFWCSDVDKIVSNRRQDSSHIGSVIDVIYQYFTGNENISDFDRILIVGSVGLMKAFKDKIYDCFYGTKISNKCEIIASINSPMQCMMGGVCGSCLQRKIIDDQEEYIFSCLNQEQNIKNIDFDHLQDRLSQNSLQEKISKHFLNMLM
ncbi:hypothetical protein GUI12_02815 [Anaplasmataceae bacterium AB001_6]|nr:hypothetical protein GUI12_02815 [Anaplasmataceae bacterium AB001_6]